MLTMSEIQAMITDALDHLEKAFSLVDKAKANLRSAVALYEDCKAQDSTILKGLEKGLDEGPAFMNGMCVDCGERELCKSCKTDDTYKPTK